MMLASACPRGCQISAILGMDGMGVALLAMSKKVTMSGLEDLSFSARSFWAGGSSFLANMASATVESLATSATKRSAMDRLRPFWAT